MIGTPRPLVGFRRWAVILLPIVMGLRAILFLFQLHGEHTHAAPAEQARFDNLGTQARSVAGWDEQAQVMQIASDYVASHFKDFDVTGKPLRITDAGTSWHAEFNGENGKLAGAPVLDIDKASLRVIHATRQP